MLFYTFPGHVALCMNGDVLGLTGALMHPLVVGVFVFGHFYFSFFVFFCDFKACFFNF